MLLCTVGFEFLLLGFGPARLGSTPFIAAFVDVQYLFFRLGLRLGLLAKKFFDSSSEFPSLFLYGIPSF